MVSRNGYITVTELEGSTLTDYSAIDSIFTDDNLYLQISDAEDYINGYIGFNFEEGTIPDDIKLLTCKITEILITNWMIRNKIGSFAQENGIEKDILANTDIVAILEKYRDLYSKKLGIYISKYVHTNEKNFNRYPLRW